MLEKIRQIAHHPLFKIFFFFLAVIFALSLGDIGGGKNSNVVATIGKEKISINEFSQARHNDLKQLNQRQDLTPEQIQETTNYIDKNVINKLVAQSLIKQELNHLAIKVPAEVLAEYIHKDSNFQKNGSFDLATYKQILELNNLKEENLLESLSTQVSSKFLLDSLVANLPLKNNLTNFLYDYLAEKRSISLLNIDASKITINNFLEENLKDYYQKHPNQFQSKEYRSFSYILLNDKKLKHNTELTEIDLQKEYEANKEEYSLPETRDFHHFLTPNQETANQIINSLASNQDHLIVAKGFIDQKVISEKFTNQPQQSFLSSLDPSLFQLQENEITSAIKSDLGWHIFKITKIHPKQYKPFTEAKKEVKERLEHKILEAQLYELSKQVEDDIASGADFNDIATRYQLSLIQVKDIAADGTQPDGGTSKIEPNIINIAFQTPIHEESSVTMLSNLNLFVVKVEDVKPPKLQDFSNVKAQVQELFITQTKDDIAAEIAKLLQSEAEKKTFTLTQAINSDILEKLLKSIYEKYKLSSKTRPIISVKVQDIIRPVFGYNGELPEVFINNLFNLGLNKTSIPQKIDSAKYSFAQIQNIITSKTRDSQIYKQMADISEMNYKNEIYDQYLDYLRNKYPIKINVELLNRKHDE